MIACQHPLGVQNDYLVDVPAYLDVDSIIERLVAVRGQYPTPHVDIPESDIKGYFFTFHSKYQLITTTLWYHLCFLVMLGLICQAKKIILSQDILLLLEPPLKIVGDIHGQYGDLLRLFEHGEFPPFSNYLFLGGLHPSISPI